MKPVPQREAQASTPTHVSSTNLRRRRFLLALGAGTATAAAAAAPVAPPVDATTPADETSQGYRVTDHVRDYYASTRL